MDVPIDGQFDLLVEPDLACVPLVDAALVSTSSKISRASTSNATFWKSVSLKYLVTSASFSPIRSIMSFPISDRIPRLNLSSVFARGGLADAFVADGTLLHLLEE